MNPRKKLAIVVVLLFAPSAIPQEPSPSKFTVHSNLVFLPTQVQTKKGETIYGLKAEDFIVEENGVRQVVQLDEDPEVSGLSLVVAIECGRSAEIEFPKLKGLGAMIDKITGAAPHEVAVVSFGAGPNVLSDFSTSSSSVRLGLSKLKPCGESYAASIDTVSYAMSMLKRRKNHYRRAILLISETRDHGSRSKLDDVAAELGVTDTAVYTVAFAPAKDEVIEDLRNGVNPPKEQKPIFPAPPLSPDADAGTPSPPDPTYTEHAPLFAWPPELLLVINALRRNSASEIASLSGGEHLKFTSQRSFEEDLQRISSQLHSYYLLSYTPPPGPAWGFHTLHVRVVDRSDVVIQTRKTYWAGISDSSFVLK